MSELAFASASVGQVLLNVWRRGAKREDVEALERKISALTDQTGEAAAVLMVIPENTSLPDDGARRATGAMLRAGGITRVVVVIEGGGFGASAMRSVFAGLGLVYRPGFSWTVKAELATAIDWLEGELPGGLDRPALLTAAQRLREALEL